MEEVMKIGEFSKKYDLSIDTVRHYMDIGILTPIKKGGHYYFGSHTEQQGHTINKLKQLGFKLGEIRKILLYKIFTQIDYDYEKDFHHSLMTRKYDEIKIEKDKLSKVLDKLENEIRRLESLTVHQEVYGVPLLAMDLLQCPKCQGDLSLNATRIIKSEVITGELACSCKYTLKIKDGILVDESSYISEDTLDHTELMKYIDSTPLNYMLESKKSINWLTETYVSKEGKNKVLLDVGTGFGLFARSLLDSQRNDNLLICNDIDRSNLESVKRILECSGEKKRVAFLACDLKSLPIKDNCIDILSSIGTSMLVQDKEKSLVDFIYKHMKSSSDLYLMETFYNKIDPDNKRVLGFRDEYKKEAIEKNYEKYNYIKESEYLGDPIGKGGSYEPLTKEKDEMYFYCLHYSR